METRAMPDRSGGNQILEALPAETLRALAPERVEYALGAVLYEPDRTPRAVYFPHHGTVISIVRSTADGSMVESGMIGSEGLLSIHTILDDPRPTGSEAIVQIAGPLSAVDIPRLRAQFGNDAATREAILLFTSYLLDHLTQNLVCNRLHEIERRLAKWLLLARDRSDCEELTLTQEFLSHMLGVHRPGVSIAIGALALDGLIEQRRQRVRILDPEGLKRRSCECYGVLHAHLRHLLGALASFAATAS